jgi:hypothetical protein
LIPKAQYSRGMYTVPSTNSSKSIVVRMKLCLLDYQCATNETKMKIQVWRIYNNTRRRRQVSECLVGDGYSVTVRVQKNGSWRSLATRHARTRSAQECSPNSRHRLPRAEMNVGVENESRWPIRMAPQIRGAYYLYSNDEPTAT